MTALRRHIAARYDNVELGIPAPIDGDVVIQFRGDGVAKFRVQHARDAGGWPDDLSWCDVTAISNRNVTPEKVVSKDRDEIDPRGGYVGSMLVGEVNGNFDAVYRRHSAGWLRVLPLNDDNGEEWTRCRGYTISIQKAT